jgi:hypothetical protein
MQLKERLAYMSYKKTWFIILTTLLLGVADGWYLSAKFSEIKIAEAKVQMDSWWKEQIIAHDFAQYNFRSAVWEWRTLEDVSMTATIQGRGIALDDLQYVNYSLDKRRSRK